MPKPFPEWTPRDYAQADVDAKAAYATWWQGRFRAELRDGPPLRPADLRRALAYRQRGQAASAKSASG
jgi:hypothetical protein